MGRYFLRRLLQAVFLLWGVCTLLFLLLHAMPGDPSLYFFNPDFPSDISHQMRESLGLNESLLVQYWNWFRNVVLLDFQYSLISQRPVLELIGEALPRTLLLALCSLGIIFTLGIFGGLFSALRRNSTLDRLVTVIALFFYSVPTFWLGLMLILLFASWLPIFPVSGTASVNAEFLSSGSQFLDRLWHLVLPAFTLGLANAAIVFRYARAGMIETLGQDYVRVARAKGLPERKVIFRHALRNALLPIFTLLGLMLPFFLGGAVLVEKVFGWHGMGSLIVDSILKRDYPVVLGTTFFFTLLVVFGSLLADLLYRFADPRIGRA